MERGVVQSSGTDNVSRETEAGSHTQEPVEELQRKQEKYEVWRSSSNFEETLEYLRDEESHHQQKSLDMTLIRMGEDEGKLIGEAIASHPSLEVLTIKLDSRHDDEEVRSSPMDSFLEAAFLREKRNTSLLSLFTGPSHGTDGELIRLGLLPRVLRENTSIRQLFFQWRDGDRAASLKETNDLLEALQDNSTIESVALSRLESVPEFEDFPEPKCEETFIHASTFKHILNLLTCNASIQRLQIHLAACRPSTPMNLGAFYTALTSNSTIRILHLTGPFYTQFAESEFSNWIRTTLTLTELHLDGADIDASSLLKLVIEALADNRSLQKVSLDRFDLGKDDDFFSKFSKLEEIGAGGHPTIREIFLNSIKCGLTRTPGNKPGILDSGSSAAI